MQWSWTSYAIPLFAAAASCLLVARLGVRRRAPGAAAFGTLLAAVAVWSAAYALELLSLPLAQKLFWARVQYLGIVTVPVAWLLFALRFARRLRRVEPQQVVALSIVPVLTLVLLWTPRWSGLIWRTAELTGGSGLDLLRLSYGWWFWVHTLYSHALWIVATVVFMMALRRSPHLYRKQGPALSVAVFAPYVLNVLYVLGASTLDLTPFGFVLTGVATSWTLARQQFLDILPVARARIVEGMRDGVLVLDESDRIVDFNPAAAAIIGRPAGAIIGNTFEELSSGRMVLRTLPGEDSEQQLEAWIDGDRRRRTYELRSWPLANGQESLGRLMVFRDITPQKRAEDAARSSEERLRVVIEQMPAVLWTTDAELAFTQMLGAGLQQLCVSLDAAGRLDVYEMFGTIDTTHPAIGAHLRALEGVAATYSVEWFGRDFECHVEPLLDGEGTPQGVIGVGLDVTERQDLQEQLRQSQKMEAIGRMAGGVAHDFNNLLTAVVGYVQLAYDDLDNIGSDPEGADKLRRDLDAIGHAAERATSITAQLLAFSRRQVLQPRVLDLNDTLRDMDTMLRRLLGGHIELLTALDPDCHPVKIDPVQVQQVVINLVLNARDAMPTGGSVTFETGDVELAEAVNAPYDVIPAGRYVVLTVTDTGVGMDDRTRARLFEPFFTTKVAGKGTGLGLSTVYGIVRQTGGYITVDSSPDEGAAFRIYVPARQRSELVGGDVVADAPVPHLRGTETVLLVEDEPMVRDLASRVLTTHGYRVLEAEDGEGALEMCRRHEGPVDLLLTDVVMPGMNGSELAHHIGELIPGISVLFISGYTGGAMEEHGVVRNGTNFLQKPFSPLRLMSKVREVLDSPG